MLGLSRVQFGELGDQLHRQVVHRVVTQVLQRSQDRTLAGTAEAGDDHQFGLAPRYPLLGWGGATTLRLQDFG